MMHNNELRGLLLGALLTALAAAAPADAADDVTITPLLRARTTTCLLELDGTVYGGLDGGGLVRWTAADPGAETEVWQAGDGLSGNYVSDLVWSGRNLWVATIGAGLTRVTDPATTPGFRIYADNLSGLDVTALDAAVIGDQERVWYGVAAGGVGQVVNGIAGATYTAERNGLVANDVTAIAITGAEVFFGTPAGVSRFANNVFTTLNAGLSSLAVDDLAVAPDGELLAGGPDGVFAWVAALETWTLRGTPGWRVKRLDWLDGTLVVLGTSFGQARLATWDGTAFVEETLPYPQAGALACGDRLWVGGRERRTGMGNSSGFAWLGVQRPAGDGFDIWSLDDGTVVGNVEGLTFGNDGRAWLGSWAAQGLSGLLDGAWTNIWELASADNDSSGLINHSGNVLGMATGADGVIWAGQFNSGGVLRHDPATGRTDQLTPDNCGLAGRRIGSLAAHPDGPVMVLHDGQPSDYPADRVQILVDPVHWRGDANWITLPTGPGGLGDGTIVWSALVDRRDVIWFAVEGTGLVRWDINGDAAGPDDPLTWFDQSDDRWDPPIVDFPGITSTLPMKPRGLAAGPDGSIWVGLGGDGLVRFRYDADVRFVTVVDNLRVKESPLVEGLLGGGVQDIAAGRNGDLWVANLNGLNRVRLVDGDPRVDAWIDLMNYVGNETYGTLYSPNVIAPLPGFIYRKVVADPRSDRLLLSSDRGAVLIIPGGGNGGNGGDGGALAGLYVYPNPWRPDVDGVELAFGGVDTTENPALVRVYTVEGQLVYPDGDLEVRSGEGFWDGRRNGKSVATGLYVVQVTWGGATVLRPVAVVR